jgi:hypothetical protein
MPKSDVPLAITRQDGKKVRPGSARAIKQGERFRMQGAFCSKLDMVLVPADTPAEGVKINA